MLYSRSLVSVFTCTSLSLTGIPNPGSRLTDWYVKPTSSGRCLNYKSNHPISKKIGVVKVKIKSIYTKLKDTDDKLEQSNLVYKIPCECKKCYIGQTKQKLKKRLERHRNDSKPRNAQKTNTTALAEHHFKTGHIFKFDETKILHKEDNWYKRNIS
ncbi:hypothetical protein M0804_015069 [Polistes exclamans]|nr:hypothetical protein M0804_015069 [Polistes exclamans]